MTATEPHAGHRPSPGQRTLPDGLETLVKKEIQARQGSIQKEEDQADAILK
jgi:hypothetical protein